MLDRINIINNNQIRQNKIFLKPQNRINFTSDNDTFVKKPVEKTEKDKKRANTKMLAAVGALAIAGLCTAALYSAYPYKGKAPIGTPTPEKLKEKINDALNQNPELKAKTDEMLKGQFSFDNITDLMDASGKKQLDLENFTRMLAMDAVGEAPAELQVKNLVAFNKMDDSTFSKFKKMFFSALGLQNQEISYDGDINKTTKALQAISEQNPTQRVFFDIVDEKDHSFIGDLKKNKDFADSFLNFFEAIKGKKISLITSNFETLKYLEKMPQGADSNYFGYTIGNLSKFIQAYMSYLRKNIR